MTGLMNIHLGLLYLDAPLPLVALLTGAAAIATTLYGYMRCLRRKVRIGRRLLTGLRLATIILVMLTLLHPMWRGEREFTQKPDIAVILDTSRSMNEPAAENQSRYQQAVSIIKNSSGNMRRKGSKSQLHIFDLEGRSLNLDELPASPQAVVSPISTALFNTRNALGDRSLAGIVLLSDGREVSGDQQAFDPSTLGIPVYPILIDDAGSQPDQRSDLSVYAAIANRDCLVDNAVRVTVLLANANGSDRYPIELRLLDGGYPVARKMIRWTPGEVDRTEEIMFIPRKAGTHSLRVHARYVDQQGNPIPGYDPDPSNNWASFTLHARRERLTVMYVDGVLRWEGKFIRDALDRDQDVNLISAIRLAPPEHAPPSDGLFTASQLANIDVVFIGDVEADYFTPIELVELRRWVLDSGGGILMTGGYSNFRESSFGQSPLAAALPVTFMDGDASQIEEPFNIRLTQDGYRHPVFSVTGDPAKDRAIWQSLPRMPGCSRIASIKPGARILAVNPQAADSSYPQGLPIIVEHQVGSGRVMVLALDSTWLWRTYVGGYTGESAFYDKFWGQVVRYLAGDPEPRQQVELLTGTERPAYEPGDEVQVMFSLRDTESAADADEANWTFSATATHDEGGTREMNIVAVGSNRYRATLTPDRPGNWNVQIKALPRLTERAGQLSSSVTVPVTHPDMELANSRTDIRNLERIAQSTGGRILTPAELEQWRKGRETVTVKQAAVTGIWHHPAWISLILMLLCAEWILRRLWRLA